MERSCTCGCLAGKADCGRSDCVRQRQRSASRVLPLLLDGKFEFVLPMQHRIAAFSGQYALQLIEILHGSVNPLDELAMAAMTKIVDGMASLGFEGQRVAVAQIDKPAVERPAALCVRIIVSLLVERT